MANQFLRTQLLLGQEAIAALKSSHVAVFGVGGVGGYVVEGLARSGVGHLTIVDADTVSLTNLNRQIVALHSTLDKPKVEVMHERIQDINPDAQVDARKCFFLQENTCEFDFEAFDYVVDAVDTVSAKLALIECAKAAQTPVISAMGAGNKLDPTRFEVADIYETSMCPLAKVMRKELRRRGVSSLKVVYSREAPAEHKVSSEQKQTLDYAGSGDAGAQNCDNEQNCDDFEAPAQGRRSVPGSTPFAPSVMGLIIASEVVKDLTSDS